MLAIVVVVVLLLLLLLVLPVPAATANDPAYLCDVGTNTYAPNSTFEANLNLLVSRLQVNASASPAGFANATAGAAPDQVYALAMCRGDVANASSCAACLAAAFRDARRGCSGYRDVTAWEDGACLLRFSGRRFLDFLLPDQWLSTVIFIGNIQSNGSVDGVPEASFSAAVSKILNATVDRAVATVAGNATTKKYFATGEEDFDPRMYGLAQCVPEMSPAQCRDCLGSLREIMTTTYSTGNLQWVRLLSQWCNLMYGVQPFFEGRAMLQLAPPPEPAAVPPLATPEHGAGKKRRSVGLPGGIACSVLILLVL